ncbi:DNA-directed RNA polymerase subunit alpha [Paenibacillus sp. AD87]|nr:DNA-directed RNA polymerase subunit alpha [Paenibacillus sp. AD87]
MRIMDYEGFRTHLKKASRKRNEPLIKIVAFQEKYMKIDEIQYYDVEQNYMSVQACNTLWMNLKDKSFRNLVSHDLKYFQTMDNLGRHSLENLIKELYDMAVPILLDYDPSDFYSLQQLSEILVLDEMKLVEKLEMGRFKGAFINEEGSWVKPKPDRAELFL